MNKFLNNSSNSEGLVDPDIASRIYREGDFDPTVLESLGINPTRKKSNFILRGPAEDDAEAQMDHQGF